MRSAWCRVGTVAIAITLLGAAEKPWVSLAGPGGKLEYRTDALGNAVPDFSNCGYGGAGVALPDVPVVETVTPGVQNDDTDRLQAAIDRVSARPAGKDGYRGAILLRRGTYRVAGTLTISASGVALRGEGDGDGGTLIIATGTKQRNVLEIRGKSPTTDPKTNVEITDTYVPVGAKSFRVKQGSLLKVGATVVVSRVGNAAWISAIGMDRIPPRPPSATEESAVKQWEPFDLKFDRVITAIDGDRVTIDAPITCAIETKWGGGSVSPCQADERIEKVGVDAIRFVSDFNRSIKAKTGDQEYFSDEDHAMYAVRLTDVKNAFLTNLTARHFYHGVVDCSKGSKWITVQHCRSIDPVSRITGARRYPFAIQAGQLVLFNRCYSSEDRHAFVVGSRVCGPNVFLECVSERAYGNSEPHHRWSVGGLYDNVKANIAIQNRQNMGTGHGWAGANYVAWNCEGSLICQSPPTAQNWAIGFVGKKGPGSFPAPDGIWQSLGRPVSPHSLYVAQLQARLGPDAAKHLAPRRSR